MIINIIYYITFNFQYLVEMWNKYQIIHPSVQRSLENLKFGSPTEIQKQVLENYKHYFDFLLASQTGSGKTLAFGIPIISELLNRKYGTQIKTLGLNCLILTPTRQLALQIQEHLNNINQNKIIKITTIIGGLSKDKQLRLLSYKPEIIIATPGRLNELIEDQCENIDLSKLKYLVIDEADRMIELGHFREVDNILGKIFDEKIQRFDKQVLRQQKQKGEQEQQANTLFLKDSKINFDFSKIQTDKLIQMPQDFMAYFGGQTKKVKKNKKQQLKNKQKKELATTNIQPIVQEQQQIIPQEEEEVIIPIPSNSKQKKKIFLVSATLTKEFKDTKYYTKGNQKEIKQKEKTGSNNQTKLFESELTPKLKALVSRIKFTAKPKIIDLSSVFLLPQLINQYISYCEDEQQKLVHLICYIEQIFRKQHGQQKKILIFTNTIKASKKISNILNLIGLQNIIIHSNMQQRQRLSKLEKFVKHIHKILICTDLAARGLDMIIDYVIQYGVPINGDTYVHRLGRTGRAGRTGQNLIIVGKTQYSKWKDILNVITQNKTKSASNIKNYLVNVNHMSQVKQKITLAQEAIMKNKEFDKEKTNHWLHKEAQMLDIILDEPKNNKHESNLRKPIKKIVIPKKANQSQQQTGKWKKNKMVLNISDIQSYLAQLK